MLRNLIHFNVFFFPLEIGIWNICFNTCTFLTYLLRCIKVGTSLPLKRVPLKMSGELQKPLHMNIFSSALLSLLSETSLDDFHSATGSHSTSSIISSLTAQTTSLTLIPTPPNNLWPQVIQNKELLRNASMFVSMT